MKDLIEQSEKLTAMIKAKEKEIDNPVLTMSMRSNIDFFIDNLEGEE